VAHRVRRRLAPQQGRPRRALHRPARQPDGAAHDDPGVAPAPGVQPARGVRRHRQARPARGRVPRAAAPALHRLQPARPDAVARQGAVEAAARLPSHPDAAVRGVPARQARPSAAEDALPAVREVGHRRRLARHRPGVGVLRPRQPQGADRVRARADRERRAGRGVHRGPRDLRRRARQRPADDAAGLGDELRLAAGGPGADRDAQGQVGPALPGAARHHHQRRRAAAGRGRAAARAPHQAHLPRAAPDRLRAHGLPAAAGRRRVRARGERQPEPRRGGGPRALGAGRRHRLR